MIPAHYSYSWALTVVNDALQKHARVSEDFLRFTGLSPRQLARLIAEGRPEWPQLRRMLQILDNWATRSPGCLTRVQTFSTFLEGKPIWVTGKLKEYLDKRLKEYILEEQGSREGAEEAKPTKAPNLPSCRGCQSGCCEKCQLQGRFEFAAEAGESE